MRTLKTILLLVCVAVFTSCDNDDPNSPNNTTCNFSGLTYIDGNGNTITPIADSDLLTQFFPNNGGPGVGAVEIGVITNPGSTFISTDVVTPNTSGPAMVRIQGTDLTGATVTCLRFGTNVGDEIRYDITIPQTPQNGEAEVCVTVDQVIP